MLVLPAQITHDDAPACARMLVQALRTEPQDAIVIDAAPLQRFDSSALAVLLQCRREALGLRKALSIHALPTRLHDLATLYGVDGLLQSPIPAA